MNGCLERPIPATRRVVALVWAGYATEVGRLRLCLAVCPVVGYGAFFPAPLGGLLAGGGGGHASAVGGRARGRLEGAGRA